MSTVKDVFHRRWNRTREGFRKDADSLKSLSGKDKVIFLWDYYKIPILAVGFVLVLCIIGSVFNIGRGDTCMYTVLVNAVQESESSLFDELLERGGRKPDGKTVNVITNYSLGATMAELYDAQTIQVLAASFAIGDLDLFGADEQVFSNYASQGAFVDLSLFIEADLLQHFTDDLVTYENEDGVEITGGIRFSPGSALHLAGYYNDTDTVVLGVTANAQNMDEALLVIKQLLTEAVD